MKYCIRYFKEYKFKYSDEVDEIEIQYHPNDTTLPDFLEEYQNKTIIIVLDSDLVRPLDFHIKRFKSLYQKYNNFVLRIDVADTDLLLSIQDEEIPYSFINSAYSWDSFTSLLDLYPYDIYIIGELGFEIQKVSAAAKERGIELGVYPNWAQNSRLTKEYSITDFFVRPEDSHLYEPYIDKYKILTGPDRLNTIYEIYAHDKHWFGNLNEIILELKDNADSRAFIDAFGQTRLSCGKRCLKGGGCRICHNVVQLSNTLINEKIIILPKDKRKTPKNK